MLTLPRTCTECPFARPLFSNRFACGNGLTTVVRGHFLSTAACLESVLNHPERYFQPQPLPDLQGLDPEWICNRIHLNLNWLDVDPDQGELRSGEHLVEVTHLEMRVYLKKLGDFYYCDRLARLRSTDAYWLALHLIHPDYLFGIADTIIAERAAMPDYF